MGGCCVRFHGQSGRHTRRPKSSRSNQMPTQQPCISAFKPNPTRVPEGRTAASCQLARLLFDKASTANPCRFSRLSGTSTRNSAPGGGFSPRLRRPPRLCTISFEIARPRPLPRDVVFPELREKRAKIKSRSAAGTPGPLSETGTASALPPFAAGALRRSSPAKRADGLGRHKLAADRGPQRHLRPRRRRRPHLMRSNPDSLVQPLSRGTVNACQRSPGTA